MNNYERAVAEILNDILADAPMSTMDEMPMDANTFDGDILEII